MESLKGTLRIKGYTFEQKSGGGFETKQDIERLLKEVAFQELYEEILDACNGQEWADKQAHKLNTMLDKAVVQWS